MDVEHAVDGNAAPPGRRKLPREHIGDTRQRRVRHQRGQGARDRLGSARKVTQIAARNGQSGSDFPAGIACREPRENLTRLGVVLPEAG